MAIRSALDFFGGRKVVRERLVAAIRDARVKAGISPAELVRLAELPDEGTVESAGHALGHGKINDVRLRWMAGL